MNREILLAEAVKTMISAIDWREHKLIRRISATYEEKSVMDGCTRDTVFVPKITITMEEDKNQG